MPFCVAYSCYNHSNDEGHVSKEGVTFHRFPKDPRRKLKWAKAAGRKNWNPSPSTYLCSEHFEERYIDRTSEDCVKIHEDAMPTIFKENPNNKNKKMYNTVSSENESDELSDENDNQENLYENENLEELEKYLKQNENEEETARISESDCPEYTEETLICMIKDNPVLYDKTVPDYWKKIKQNQTWRALADMLNIPVKECQQHWDALLLKYKAQRKVIRKFKARGHKAKSTWPLYETINFMDQHLEDHFVELKRNETTRTLEVNNAQDEQSQSSHIEEESRNSYEEDNALTEIDNLTESHSERYETNPELEPITEEVINNFTQSPLIRLSDNVSATKRVISDVNEDVQFVNSLLPVLVRMKRKKKALCKAEIMTILANYESEDEP